MTKISDEIRMDIKAYIDNIKDIKFATVERETLDYIPDNFNELSEYIKQILKLNVELNIVCENSPNSIVVADENGKYIRVNRRFEKMVGIDRDNVVGKDAVELGTNGTFNPSVCQLAMQEKRRVSVIQHINGLDDVFVTAIPIKCKDKGVFRTVSNAIRVEEIKKISAYLSDAENRAERDNKSVELIAESRAMEGVLKIADEVKDTDSNILITGETGVGKGHIAKYIHDTGARSKGKFVTINCGAIPENLIEAELFGYEAGAFTNASSKGKIGLIELSDGGTIFLDEIGDVPLMVQVKLLNFIQSKTFTRVGGVKEKKIDARIIAATNANLEECVERGTFRLDLYYRMNVIPIRIPSLKERPEDIIPLAEHYIKVYEEKYRKKVILSEKMKDDMKRVDWKGNVRELENFIERFVVTNELEILEAGAIQNGCGSRTMRDMKKQEDDCIAVAYEKYGSSYKVAKELGISQSTAYRKIKKIKCVKSE